MRVITILLLFCAIALAIIAIANASQSTTGPTPVTEQPEAQPPVHMEPGEITKVKDSRVALIVGLAAMVLGLVQ